MKRNFVVACFLPVSFGCSSELNGFPIDSAALRTHPGDPVDGYECGGPTEIRCPDGRECVITHTQPYGMGFCK